MSDYREDLESSTVYISNNISVYFDGHQTFTCFDTSLPIEEFYHPDVISMQHARDIAERYIKRTFG